MIHLEGKAEVQNSAFTPFIIQLSLDLLEYMTQDHERLVSNSELLYSLPLHHSKLAAFGIIWFMS